MTASKQQYQPLNTTEDAPPPAYEAAVKADLAQLAGRATPPFPVVQAAQPVRGVPALHREALLIVLSQRATAPMRVSGARNPKQVPVGLDGKREWSHGLCACLETPGLTAEAMCCPCLVFNANRERLVHLTQTGERASPPRSSLPYLPPSAFSTPAHAR